MFSVGSVSGILKAHKKTISLLEIREKELIKNQVELVEKQVIIDKVIKESEKERRQAKAASTYLSGLFKAVEEA